MKLTEARKREFLRHLAEHGVAREAARGASPHAKGADGAYKTFADERNRNPAFAQAWDDAIAEAIGKLEREAFRRGVEGWVERGVFDKDGNRVGDVVRFSDRMLELALKRHVPEYRERAQLDVNGRVQIHADLRARIEADIDSTHERRAVELFRELAPEARSQLRALLAPLARTAPVVPSKPSARLLRPIESK